LDSVGAEWHMPLEKNRGRLYIHAKHVRVETATGPECMRLELNARGPIKPEMGWTLEEGIKLGHDSIVLMFAAMTSKEAHAFWKRTD
ncbi:MAG: hypothetical protein KZQ82_07105, partial [Candidatus Thiodiazotropha sp. (ex Lucinoma annulata)]|nr:hypothetical protein [Candidatus Thiodiazotropha sp. (ex Lucinoma annulata)]